MKCPNCNHDINPAQELGKLSAKKRDVSSEAMKALRAKGKQKVTNPHSTSDVSWSDIVTMPNSDQL